MLRILDPQIESSGPVTGRLHLKSVQSKALEGQYEVLKGMARRLIGGAQNPASPDPTEIVHECFLRMRQVAAEEFSDLRRFRAYAADTMRSVLVDWVRREQRLRRGGGQLRITLDDSMGVVEPSDSLDLLALDEALVKLEAGHAVAALVVKLRFFGGFEAAEIAEQLGVSRRTVGTTWNFGRAWLARELGHGDRS